MTSIESSPRWLRRQNRVVLELDWSLAGKYHRDDRIGDGNGGGCCWLMWAERAGHMNDA